MVFPFFFYHVQRWDLGAETWGEVTSYYLGE
jgi:hypothetical protein